MSDQTLMASERIRVVGKGEPGVHGERGGRGMFAAGAEAWLERLSGLTLGEAREIWPDVVEVYEGS